VFLQNGNYQCTFCGEELQIPEDEHPLAMIHAASGEPNVQTITLHGQVIHVCALEGAGK